MPEYPGSPQGGNLVGPGGKPASPPKESKYPGNPQGGNLQRPGGK